MLDFSEDGCWSVKNFDVSLYQPNNSYPTNTFDHPLLLTTVFMAYLSLYSILFMMILTVFSRVDILGICPHPPL